MILLEPQNLVIVNITTLNVKSTVQLLKILQVGHTRNLLGHTCDWVGTYI